MGWFRSDDGLPEHAKADALVERCTPQQLAAAWMTWLHLGCDCRARGTDGVFTRARALRAVRLPQAVVERALDDLTAVGLLDKGEEGWTFHGWLEYQPSAEEEDERRESIRRKRSDAGRRGNEVRWKGGSQTDRKPIANASQTDRKGVAPGSQEDRKSIAPSHPIPSHPISPPTPSRGLDVPSADPLKAAARAKLEASLARVGAPRLAIVDGGSDG